MKRYIITDALISLFILFFSVGTGFLLGAEYQRYVNNTKVKIQTHVISLMVHDPHRKIKPKPIFPKSNPKLFENQEHKIEIEAIDESSELYCMAQNIYFEAGNQSRAGKIAVARVVMNRVKNPGWPDTICDVVKQKMQFSWYWDGVHDIPNKKSKTWKDSVEVATEVMFGKIAADEKLDAALHYHADYVKPYWAKKKVMIAKIDDHIFYGR